MRADIRVRRCAGFHARPSRRIWINNTTPYARGQVGSLGGISANQIKVSFVADVVCATYRPPPRYHVALFGSMFRHSVSCGGAPRQTGDTVFRHHPRMTTRKAKLARKPRLDWIKEVLADLADDGEAESLPSGIVWRSAAASADFQSLNDRSQAPEADEQWFCPSWQQVRLVATPRS